MNATLQFQLVTTHPAVPLLDLEPGQAGWISRNSITHAQCTQMAPTGQTGRGLVWLDPATFVWPAQINPLPVATPPAYGMDAMDLARGTVERSSFLVRTEHHFEVYEPGGRTIHYMFMSSLPTIPVVPAFTRTYDMRTLPGAHVE